MLGLKLMGVKVTFEATGKYPSKLVWDLPNVPQKVVVAIEKALIKALNEVMESVGQ